MDSLSIKYDIQKQIDTIISLYKFVDKNKKSKNVSSNNVNNKN